MIKRLRKNLEGIGKIIPKAISLDNQNQNIRRYESINITEHNISFENKYTIDVDYVKDLGYSNSKGIDWTTNTRYGLALAGASGGRGGAATNTAAVSRIDVIDPHILMMMRDVMDASETAPRLKVQGQATGGGGGGGGSQTAGDSAANGGNGVSGSAVTNAIVATKQGEGGTGGQGTTVGGPSGGPTANQFPGGGGGGGAGGGGGVVVICTTTASGSFLSSNVDVSGGAHGDGGTPSFSGGSGGSDGDDGKDGTKLWIQV